MKKLITGFSMIMLGIVFAGWRFYEYFPSPLKGY